jgi:hypothetical protein
MEVRVGFAAEETKTSAQYTRRTWSDLLEANTPVHTSLDQADIHTTMKLKTMP